MPGHTFLRTPLTLTTLYQWICETFEKHEKKRTPPLVAEGRVSLLSMFSAIVSTSLMISDRHKCALLNAMLG